MTLASVVPAAASGFDHLGGGGETGALIHEHDWSASPLGSREGWPLPLKTLVGVMLGSNQPMFIAWGPERTLLYNDAYAEVLASKHPAALGRDFLEVWSEIRADLAPIVSETYAGVPVQMDDIKLVMHRKGYPEETHFSFFYAPVRDEAGRVGGVYCACTETTGQVLAERRRGEAEAALRAERDRTRRVLDGMAEGFGLLDHEFRLVDINAEGLRLEGRPREEIIGKTHWEAWPGSEESELGRLYKRAVAEGVPVNHEHHFVWPDSHEAWLEMRGYPTDDGLALFWRDITERKQAEKRLRESDARLRLALEASRLAEITFHLENGAITHGPALAELFGHGSDKRLTLAEFRAQYHPDDNERVLAERTAVLEGKQGFYEVHKRIVWPDGQVRWLYGRGSVVRDPQGRAVSITAVYLDETDRKRTEAALRESEARFRLMADAVPQIIWITDPDGRTEFFNKQWSDYTGAAYEQTTANEIAAKFVHPEDAAATVAAFDESRRTGTDFLVEHRIRSRTGEYRWFLVRGQPYRDQRTGKIVRWFGASADIHDRRRAEAAMRESEARLSFLDRLGAETAPLVEADAVLATTTRLLGEHLNLSVCAYADMDDDQDGFTIRGDWAAPGSKSIVGHYSLADFGKLAVGNLSAGLPLVVNDNLRELAPEEAATFQSIGIAATICMPLVKERRLIALMAVHDRVPRVWTEAELNLLREVTARSWAHVERVASTAELRQSEARLRELNETLEARVTERTAERNHLWTLSQDMLARADFGGMMSAVSPAWTRVLGWSESELLTRPYASFMHPDDIEPTMSALARMSETGQPARFENRISTSDGGWKPIGWTVAPEPDGAKFIAVGRDLSDVRAREAELEAAQDALRQSQKMEAMGQLTGGVAHDFNNLLTPIIGSLDMLMRRGVGSERERRMMDGALQSAERAKTLVQRLLAFARRQPLQPSAVDVTGLIGGMAELIASTLGPKVDVRVDLPEELPPAKADPNQLEMAVLNLAVNARDAMPDGGRLTLSATSEFVGPGHRSKLRAGHYVRLSVTDTGTGMDDATRQRAIEPFFSTKGIGKGTGLGLSMVHGLAAQLGGGLTIESALGQGTTVDLWLPISPVAVGDDDEISKHVNAREGLGTALLVDDEDLVRMSTADMLLDLGYEVVEANSAEDALRLVSKGVHPDLLVTDHLMPGMSGVELARILRSSRPEMPVLIVSGYAEAEGLAPDLPRLTKPFRNAELALSLSALRADAPRLADEAE